MQIYAELIRQANTEIVLLKAKLLQLEESEATELTMHEIRLILAQLKVINQTFKTIKP